MPDLGASGTTTDIFSFACVVYLVLTGDEFFPADTPVQAMIMMREKKRRSILEGRALAPELRNPRLTAPEVVRLARMGTMPRVLVEVIVSNGAWIAIPEVRRALLTNPRLGADQIPRVLRAMPKHELKLCATQAVYPMAVREAAKRLVRGG